MSNISEGMSYTHPRAPDDVPDVLSRACDICLQVGIAVATLATACFITLAALHYFTVASAMIASFTGVADIILIAGLSCKKSILETPPFDFSTQVTKTALVPGQSVQIPSQVQSHVQTASNPVPAPSLRPAKPPVILPPNPLTAQEWDESLHILPPNPNFCGYNLIDPTQPPAPNAKNGCIALPTFGNYKSKYLDILHRPAMGVRLPLSQLRAFPQPIQDLFQTDPETELYFFIFDDSGAMNQQRNLVLHHMVIPEYDNNAWMRCPIEVGIFECQGIEKPINHPDRLALNRLTRSHVHLHPDEAEPLAISPDNCIFVPSPKAPVSSFYTAARFRGRSVAFYTLLIRDLRSPEGKMIQAALQHKLLSAVLQALQLENSPSATQIKKLFTYCP